LRSALGLVLKIVPDKKGRGLYRVYSEARLIGDSSYTQWFKSILNGALTEAPANTEGKWDLKRVE